MTRIDDFAALASTVVGRPLGADTTQAYDELWAWSVEQPDAFWATVATHLGLDLPGPALAEERMPGAVWFPEARVNYAAAALRPAEERPDEVAVVGATEDPDADVEITWAQLRDRVAGVAATLRDLGVGRGDRVVGFVPNTPDAVVALLATVSLGAVWSVCGMDYAASAAQARFGQLDPVVLIHADDYLHGGRRHDRRDVVAEIVASLPDLRATLRLGSPEWERALAREAAFEPVEVAFDHPLWVLFSSGTTGRPKGIVHGHGGALIEQAKVAAYHFDLGPGERLLWYTTPSWMMWNFVVGGLLTGASIVTYDGSPARPGPDGLWALASRLDVTVLGMSPGYVAAVQKVGLGPAGHDLSRLRRVGISGSTFPATSHEALAADLGEGVQICSISGGTDVVSAFVGPVPGLPVWPGELSRPCLGVALDAFDPMGEPVRGEVGELVVTRPMPSMPIGFWDDADGARYRDAYFDVFPGVWRHGDWITLTDHGSIVIHGRSDATLNRNGIRMGSGDIYEPVEALPEVLEALVLGIEEAEGRYWMPLFVVLADGVELDDALRGRICDAVRTHASPRHVPDEVIAAPGVPHTRTGKKLEVPVKKVLSGQDLGAAYDPGSVDAPELIDWYREVGAARHRSTPVG